MKKLLAGGIAATVLVVVGLVFYACNKDKEFNTRDAKLMGSTGIWDCNVENPIGTIIVPEGQIPPCTRYFVKRNWNEAKQRYSSFSHTTEIHQCEAMDIFANIEFVAELVPVVLNAPPGVVIDYRNINNFNLRVDGRVVTTTFLYEKPFTYKITTPDGNVITKTGKIRITRENVLNVWEEINSQMEWGGMVIPTEFTNPYEQYGIWHNECLEYIFSHMTAANAGMTTDELWQTYGVQYFRNVWGADYVPTPLPILHAAYERVNNIVVNRRHLSLLQELVNAGRINPDFNIQSLIAPLTGTGTIRRNNYNILLDYFTFLTNYNVTNAETYQFAHNKLCAIEQEILANRYILVNGGLIAEGDDIYDEYEGVLLCMAVARNSERYWRFYHIIGLEPILATSWGQAYKIANADGIGTFNGLMSGNSAFGATEQGASASNEASGKYGGPNGN